MESSSPVLMDKATLAPILQADVDATQGHLHARPMTDEDLLNWLLHRPEKRKTP